MGENTKIEWAHHTFNPWRGCTKVSPGCANCYAATFSKRNPGLLGVWGDDGTRVIAAPQNWLQVLNWNDRLEGTGQRERVFCASLADVFEDWTGPVMSHQGHVEIEASVSKSGEWKHREKTISDVRRTLFEVIDRTPNLDWLLVTKRPENIRKFWVSRIETQSDLNEIEYRPNVWLLTSVENQEQADKRIPELLKCRDLAPVLGLSCEPLLGPVDLRLEDCWLQDDCYPLMDRLNWVIVGGESGPDARPMHPDWARSLRDQCDFAAVPFFFKQWGEWCAGGKTQADREKGARQFMPGRYHDFGDDFMALKLGKKESGRLFYGREHNEFPLATRQ